MKKIKILITFVMAAMLFGCSEDENNSLDVLADAAAPTNVSALFTITQDNTGTVTIRPRGEGVVSFEVHYGDGTAEPALLNVGGSTVHVYDEGVYSVTIVAVGINGKTTEVSLPLTVSLLAPTNVVATVVNTPGNSFGVTVGATADLETYFTVTYGEDPNQVPVQFMEGETVTHNYTNIGTYTVTVTAYSGGTTFTTVTSQVTITNPLLLPIDFESSSLEYEFTNFGGAAASVVNNPNPSGINTSAKVGSMTPAAGQPWTGGYLTLGAPIDLSTHKNIRIKVWSPQAGVPVLLKLENVSDGAISSEVSATTTTANAWEELTYNFAGATQQYSKIVLFFNAANAGTGDTYYFDDIEQFSASVLPLNFESDLVYTWNNFGGAIGNEVANPQANGINTSARVGQYYKNAGSETWAGVAIPLATPIDFSDMQHVKMKVWSPQAGIIVLMKFENMNPHVAGDDIEKQTTTTVANQWEELTFDFTGIDNSNNYQQIVLFFNFNVPGTGETYYFDDINLSN